MAAPATPSEAIIGRLLAVTTGAGSRIYPAIPTQDPEGSYIVVTKTAGGGSMRLGRPGAVNQYSMRVDCYAATEAAAEALLAECLDGADGEGGLAGWSDKANKVLGCFPQPDADEQITEDGGGGVYKVSGQTFGLWFKG